MAEAQENLEIANILQELLNDDQELAGPSNAPPPPPPNSPVPLLPQKPLLPIPQKSNRLDYSDPDFARQSVTNNRLSIPFSGAHPQRKFISKLMKSLLEVSF